MQQRLPWEIIENEIPRHLAYRDLWSMGHTCRRLVAQWRNWVHRLPHHVFYRIPGKVVDFFPHLRRLPGTLFRSAGFSLVDNLGGLSELDTVSLGLGYLIGDENLRRLTGLKKLHLDGRNGVSDEGLSVLTNLTSLSLGQCDRISDASLSALTALTSLTVPFTTSITDMSVSRLTALRKLTVCTGSITDHSISKLTALTRLNVDYACSGITENSVGKMTALKTLGIRGGPPLLNSSFKFLRLVGFDGNWTIFTSSHGN